MQKNGKEIKKTSFFSENEKNKLEIVKKALLSEPKNDGFIYAIIDAIDNKTFFLLTKKQSLLLNRVLIELDCISIARKIIKIS